MARKEKVSLGARHFFPSWERASHWLPDSFPEEAQEQWYCPLLPAGGFATASIDLGLYNPVDFILEA
jgi:hypothetical protein